MTLPGIDVNSLPGLDEADHAPTGLFGSITGNATGYDDGVVAVMVYIHDVMPPAIMV
ncbi:MAG: hypothetical protein V2J14_02240 [Erythrobacter sp.]|jgi:hypothetical protein|nr:hypothetical protein [Erythrobacter sp.]